MKRLLAAVLLLTAACSTKQEGDTVTPRRPETPMSGPARAGIPAIDAEAATVKFATATFATG